MVYGFTFYYALVNFTCGAGKDLGSAVKGFKEAVKEEEKPKITNNDDKIIIAEEVKVEKPKDNRSADL